VQFRSVALSLFILIVVIAGVVLLPLIAGLLLSGRPVCWQLVFGKVFAHFVQSVYCPQSQFWHFYPPIVHCFSVHDNNHKV
jgi:hypothetical protein